jgi:dihydrolipoamide dehydrogenase
MNNVFVRLVVITLIAAGLFAFFKYDLGQYLTLTYLKSSQAQFAEHYTANPIETMTAFFAIYVVSVVLSLPGATVLTLASGALFGLWTGFIIASFASTLGATLNFLVARFLLRDWVQSKFGERIKILNEGVKKDGALYLLTLRLVPAFPFFVVNLVMGLTPMKIITFYLFSQLGMIPGTFVYVNAGTQLSKIDSLSGLVSPEIFISFVLLGIFPLIAKAIVARIKAHKVYKGFKKPSKFDYNIITIGAGSAGLVTCYIAAAVKAKVALIEKHKMGGDCLNTGCVPSKALIRSSKLLADAKKSKIYGIEKVEVTFNFAEVMERVHNVIKKIEPHDSVERYSSLGVDCIRGEAKLISPWEVEVNGKRLTAKNIVLASGARPFLPPIPGLKEMRPLTSDNVWDIRTQPKKLLVLGGGPIGAELAQAFNRLGCNVTLVEMGPRILPREDEEVSTLIIEKFKSEGMQVLIRHQAKEFKMLNGKKVMIAESEGKLIEVEFDEVLVALGRRANTEGFGLENLNIERTKQGTFAVDEKLRTNYPNVFACGDCVGPYQFTHVAAHQAWYAAVNSLFAPLKTFNVDYRVIPWATYVDPEVARVGLNELEAKEQGIAYEVARYELDDLDRAIADSADHGMVKVLTKPGTDKILGVTIVGQNAGEIIVEYVAAMKHGFGMEKILGTIHIYPTMGEANKYAAGVWKRAHAPAGLLEYIRKFHTWRRG